jgi:transposase InsO family protein
MSGQCGIFSLTLQHREQTTAELKIRLIFSTPGVPRGRGRIERFFSTLTQLLRFFYASR